MKIFNENNELINTKLIEYEEQQLASFYLKKDDIVRYDKHAGHGIEWKDNLYYVLKLGDIVLVE